MTSISIILILILPTVYAKIQVEVVASLSEAERSVNVTGSISDIISDAERNTFRIGDDSLKDAVQKHFGQRPNDAFLHSPTPWGDLYLTYGWEEVSRTLSPHRVTIIDVGSQTGIFPGITFINNTTQTIVFNASMQARVQNTVFSDWQHDGELTIDREIVYDLKTIISTGVIGNTSFSFTSKWGEAISKREYVTVGSEEFLNIPVEPNSSVRLELQATSAKMKFRVDFEARLSGDAAVNYSRAYRGHHFWALGINNVMRGSDLETVIRSSELIDMWYYADSRVIVRDLNSNNILYTILM